MGVKEKKAITAMEEQIHGDLGDGLRKVLENKSLKFSTTIDDSVEAQGIVIAAKGLHDDFFPAMMEVGKDPDYRAELTKIKNVSFHILPEVQKPSDFYVYCNLKLDGKTLNVTVDASHTPSNGTPKALQQYIESLF